MADVILTIVDETIELRTEGDELLVPHISAAVAARVGSETAAAVSGAKAKDASLSAAAASGFVGGVLYASIAAGLAAVAADAYFTVVGDSTNTYAILYRKVSGVAVEQARYASKAAYEGPGGSALIGQSAGWIASPAVLTMRKKVGETPSIYDGYDEASIGTGNDDTVAMQRMLDQLKTHGGGSLLVAPRFAGPATSLNLSGLYIPDGVALRGPRVSGYTVPFDGTAAAYIQLFGTGAGIILGSGAAISDFKIKGLGASKPLRAIESPSSSNWNHIERISFDSFGDSFIRALGLGTTIRDAFGTAGLMIRQRGQKDGLIELAGSDHTITGMIELSASIDTLNNRGLFNDDLRICGIANRSTNSSIGGGLIVPEFCEIGYYGTQAKTKISDVRADFNLGPGFVGPGRYIGCQAEKNSQTSVRAYAGFQTFGASWMHLFGCTSISDGRSNFGADFDGSDFSGVEDRGSIGGFVSNGHTVSPIRRSSYIPTPMSQPRLEIPSADFLPTGTQLYGGMEVYDYNAGTLRIRNNANTGWRSVTFALEA